MAGTVIVKTGAKKRKYPKVTTALVQKVLKSTAERKVKYTTAAAAAVTRAMASAVCFNMMAQGTESDKRIGNKISMDRLTIRGYVRSDFSNVSSSHQQVVRILLCIDKQCNGAGMSSGALFNTGPNNTDNPAPYHPYQISQLGRFKILRDVTYVMNALQVPPSVDQRRDFHFDVKLKGLQAHYTANAGTVADIYENSLCLVYISSESSYTPYIHYTAALTYTDI